MPILNSLLLIAALPLALGNLPPQWVNNMNYQRINEDTKVGEIVYTLYGTDAEGVPCVYGIQELGRPFFTVNPVTGNVSLVRPLDREKASQHDLTVTLSDGANTLYDDIIILVEDANDNAPEFIGTPYTCDLPETTEQGSKIFQAIATDPDLGPAGSVFYSLALIDDDRDTFSIDTNTGWITLTKSLTSKMTGIHVLKITAKDGGQMVDENFKEQRSTVTLAVNVMTDKSQVLSVLENQPPDTFVGFVNRIYTPYTGKVYYFITAGNEDETFLLSSETRKLTTNVPLDRETIGLYNLTIIATKDPFAEISLRKNSKQFKKEIKVVVEDLNDNWPYFENKVYMAGVSINPSSTNHSIVSVQGSDPDEAVEKDNYYQITNVECKPSHYNADPMSHTLFKVNADNGVISPSEMIDYNWHGVLFIVTVNITDRQYDVWTDSTSVYINVISEFEAIKITFNANLNEVNEHLDQFVKSLEEIVRAFIVVDKVTFHENGGEVDNLKTDVLLHAVNKTTKFAINNEDVMNSIDENGDAIQKLVAAYDVVAIEKTVKIKDVSLGKKQEIFKAGMATSLAASAVIIVLLSGMIYCIRKRYRTKLKAATAGACLNSDLANGSFRKMSSEVLGTNKYSSEGGTYQPMYEEEDCSEHFPNAQLNFSGVEKVESFGELTLGEQQIPQHSSQTHLQKMHDEYENQSNKIIINPEDVSSYYSDRGSICGSEASLVSKKILQRKGLAQTLKYGYNPWKNSDWWNSRMIRRKQLQKAYLELNGSPESDSNQLPECVDTNICFKTNEHYGTIHGNEDSCHKFNLAKHTDTLIGKHKFRSKMSNPVWNLSGSVPVAKMDISADDVVVDLKDDAMRKDANKNCDLSLNEELSKEVVESLYSRITGNIGAGTSTCKKYSKKKKKRRNKKSMLPAKEILQEDEKVEEDVVFDNISCVLSDENNTDTMLGRLHGGCHDSNPADNNVNVSNDSPQPQSCT